MAPMALIAKLGRKSNLHAWRPVADWRLIRRGKLKGLYRVKLHDERKALATRIGLAPGLTLQNRKGVIR